ncbi:hypothetical protein HETIRDRAFT_319145 [Heterobasidion irregulare TC 32-1]|uniref:Secreted protein n=1 Tax=Heterobasidion irregulare (strain TC 32-1) TaxID=747525 RepID=W4K4W7_HETIT|nr:uncharacterized protein HETIRDRAFT_319145 [Heterobasidion irregulare TC 32-1]ETW80410.1 hypothetical protein HETIRDRAFT_319145 [Heterobasidion irregulare TC 32-1]
MSPVHPRLSVVALLCESFFCGASNFSRAHCPLRDLGVRGSKATVKDHLCLVRGEHRPLCRCCTPLDIKLGDHPGRCREGEGSQAHRLVVSYYQCTHVTTVSTTTNSRCNESISSAIQSCCGERG